MGNSYEAVFIIEPGLDKDGTEKVVDDIKGVIGRHQGAITQQQSWGKKKFAYPIAKRNEGMYYLFDLDMPANAVAGVEAHCKLNESILRTLIVRKDA